MEVPGGGVEVLDPLPAQGGVGERFPEDICQGFRVAGRSDEADAVIGYDTSHFGKVGDHHGNACPDVVEEFVGQCIAVVETEVLLDGDSQAGLPCKDPQVVRESLPANLTLFRWRPLTRVWSSSSRSPLPAMTSSASGRWSMARIACSSPRPLFNAPW